MKYYLIAGEASGDMHGANLINGIKKKDDNAEFRFFGGDLMQKAGTSLTVHYKHMAFMGLWEVLMNLNAIARFMKICRKDITDFNPDVIILIDYAGFNLKIARFAHKNGYRILYYISPKLWAWNKSRIKLFKKYVDKLYAIFPFEVDFYKENGYSNVEYLGHPLLDEIEKKKKGLSLKKDFITKNKLSEKPIIALLSGSRKQEIDRCLPEMLAVVNNFPDYQFVIAGVTSLPDELYQQFIKDTDVRIVYDQTYDLLHNAVAAVVTSGTATLETAILNIPEVVIYKTSPVTYFIAKPFVHIKFFSLVNLIMGKETVKELLQYNLTRDIKNELDNILYNKEYRQNMLNEYEEMRHRLGVPGASDRVGEAIVKSITK
jgi:lipid-A-disaccharide synthase